MTLRSRLAILTSAAVALAVLAASVAAWLLTRSTLLNDVDERLRDQVVPAARLVTVSGSPAGLAVPGISALQSVPVDIRFFAPDGTITSSVPDPRVPVAAREERREEILEAIGAGTQLETLTADGQDYRVITATLADGNVIRMVRSLEDVDDAMMRLGWLLAAVAAVGVAVAGGLGWSVARTGLRPVDRLTAAAEEVAASKDLAHRIEVDSTSRDEVARLARSVNSMLEALDTAKTQQRQLVEDAGHELRTPLATLRNDIGLLLRAEQHPERVIDPADRASLLRDLETEAAALSQLVGEVVDLARGDIEPEPPRETDLRAVVDRAVARTRRVNPDVTIAVRGDGFEASVRAVTLERAIANLVRNAVQVSPHAGSVEVILRRSGDWATVRVLDCGPGITDHDLPRLFDRFYRGEGARERQGSGLGLAIVAQAVEQHRGAVEAGNRARGGAVFTLRVPLFSAAS